MADDPKAAPLSEELREYALSLSRDAMPKNFICEGCANINFDPWKLLCCGKPLCSTCQSQLSNICPFCKHEPLEEDGTSVHKGLRSTMRTWFTNRKKKEASKPAALEPVATPPQPIEAADKPVESVEDGSKPQSAAGEQPVPTGEGDENEVQPAAAIASGPPNETLGSPSNDATPHQDGTASQTTAQSAEPTSAGDDANIPQVSLDGTAEAMPGSAGMFNMNGAAGQMMGGFGFNQMPGAFGAMGFNGMPNMMGNANPMGMFNNMSMGMMNNTSMPGMPDMSHGMYGGYGGNMGMTDMSSMNSGYGGGYGNGWQGMGGGGYGNFDGYNGMGGYNQSGYSQMMNTYPKNTYQAQTRMQVQGGSFTAHKNNGRGNQGNFGNQYTAPGRAQRQKSNSRPGSRAGPNGSDTADQDKDPQADPRNEDGDADAAHNQAGSYDEISEENVQSTGLNKIQTVESVEEPDAYEQDGQSYAMGMNDFQNQVPPMDGRYSSNTAYNNNYGPRGGYNTAYGAATVLTGEPAEPKGLGVAGAPTGPRAMREGLPNSGYSSRVINARSRYAAQSQTPSAPAVQKAESRASEDRRGRTKTPERDDVRDKSVSQQRSPAGGDDRDDYRDRSASRDRYEERKHHGRSRTPEDKYERRSESRHHHSSRYDDKDDRGEYSREEGYDDKYRDDQVDRYRDDRDDRDDAVSVDSKHRSRREKDKGRSSRSHRERSREHRRRHHTRSRSPVVDKYAEDDSYDKAEGGHESNGRRTSKTEKYRERERSRDRDRDRRDRRDYDYEKEKERSRDKDRDRKRSRRDRDDEGDDYRSSRRSRKEKEREKDKEYDRERERDRDYDYEERRPSREAIPPAVRPSSPPIDAPKGPAAQGFSIRGQSKSKHVSAINTSMPPPPSAPRAFKPPTGPSADRDRERSGRDRDNGHARRRSSMSTSIPSTPLTPTTPTMEIDHYAQERERKDRERLAREQGLHGRAAAAPSAPRSSLATKRSRDDIDKDTGTDKDNIKYSPKDRELVDRDLDIDIAPPTGPAAHREKRHKSKSTRDGDAKGISDLFTKGMRRQHGGGGGKRRGGIKTEGEARKDMERAERERERRW